MDVLDYLKVFVGSETPFMLLFVALFFFYIRTSREREKENAKQIGQRLESIQNDVRLIIQVWKILLEKELEERKK